MRISSVGRIIIVCLMTVMVQVSAFAVDSLPKGILQLDGREAPSLVLQDIDQQTFDLSKSKGNWIFLHFWASWCGPCRKEMPTIQAIAPEFEDTRLKIVLVNTAEDEDTIFSFLGIVAPELNSLMDSDGLVTERWQPRGIPATFIIDPRSRLRFMVLGGRPWNEAEYLDFLRRLIQ
ncbi:MAG: TlpA family protein disulfide reductase [Gammaproteobacteria bacterium]|nr:MAG: TlpA family protein disulfide reductase [Gammaproteobacteria bacterium]